jgi:hypothetical protein
MCPEASVEAQRAMASDIGRLQDAADTATRRLHAAPRSERLLSSPRYPTPTRVCFPPNVTASLADAAGLSHLQRTAGKSAEPPMIPRFRCGDDKRRLFATHAKVHSSRPSRCRSIVAGVGGSALGLVPPLAPHSANGRFRPTLQMSTRSIASGLSRFRPKVRPAIPVQVSAHVGASPQSERAENSEGRKRAEKGRK